jgi:hypothetical protein
VWLRSTERLDHVAYSTGETGPLWVPFGSPLSLSEPFAVALKSVCETLSLELADGPETRTVAKKIIELAQRGVRDVASAQRWR